MSVRGPQEEAVRSVIGTLQSAISSRGAPMAGWTRTFGDNHKVMWDHGELVELHPRTKPTIAGGG